MKSKFAFLFYVTAVLGMPVPGDAAVAVKKAAPVATQSASMADSSASLMGTALNLIGAVQQLNAKQKELTAECVPTSAEISFVDKIVKEWAKTGAMSQAEIEKKLGGYACGAGERYSERAKVAATTGGIEVCYDTFADADMIWYGYPRVGTAEFCPDGSTTCKNKKRLSNIYDIFNLVDFTEADYTKQEGTMAGKLIAKIENCSNAKLSAKKKALWAEFLTGTLSNVGQKTNTGTILQQVSTVTSNTGGGLGGALGGLGSLGGLASQYLQ